MALFNMALLALAVGVGCAHGLDQCVDDTACLVANFGNRGVKTCEAVVQALWYTRADCQQDWLGGCCALSCRKRFDDIQLPRGDCSVSSSMPSAAANGICGDVPDDYHRFAGTNTATTACGDYHDCLSGCFEFITCGAVPDDSQQFASTYGYTNDASLECGNDCTGCFETKPTATTSQSSTATTSQSSTAATSQSTTGTTSASTTATTTGTSVSHYLPVVYAKKNAQLTDYFLYTELLVDRQVEVEFEGALKDAYDGAMRVDHFAAGMTESWTNRHIVKNCHDSQDGCFQCGEVTYTAGLTFHDVGASVDIESSGLPGSVCHRCFNKMFLLHGECVDTCPRGYVSDGTTSAYDRQCVEQGTGRDGAGRRRRQAPRKSPAGFDPSGTMYDVSGIVVTLVFNSTGMRAEFEGSVLRCDPSKCIEFTSTSWSTVTPDAPPYVTLCPHMQGQPSCDFTAAEASFLSSPVGMATLALVLILAIVIALYVKKARSNGAGLSKVKLDSSISFTNGMSNNGVAVSFENPMYDNHPPPNNGPAAIQQTGGSGMDASNGYADVQTAPVALQSSGYMDVDSFGGFEAAAAATTDGDDSGMEASSGYADMPVESVSSPSSGYMDVTAGAENFGGFDDETADHPGRH